MPGWLGIAHLALQDPQPVIAFTELKGFAKFNAPLTGFAKLGPLRT